MNKIYNIYNKEEFDKIRIASQLVANILDDVNNIIKPGITTNDINNFCHDKIIAAGAVASCLGFHGYTKSICTSVNDTICHGVPGNYILKDGDIVNVDITAAINDFHGDSSRIYFVGDFTKEETFLAKKVTKITYDCMMLGIEIAKPGAKLLEIGKIIQNYAEKNGFSVVRDFCGHGIGKKLHEEPRVLHYYPEKSEMKKQYLFDIILEPGMCITIEPMINVGKWQSQIDENDGWTARTIDGSLSAQFEHTIGILERGNEIFTKSKKGLNFPKELINFKF